jgi:hypothetical protein
MNIQGTHRCGARWTGMNTQHCTSCCMTFSTTTAGDKHRVGKFDIDRRCANPKDVGLIQNSKGVWKLPNNNNFTWKVG